MTLVQELRTGGWERQTDRPAHRPIPLVPCTTPCAPSAQRLGGNPLPAAMQGLLDKAPAPSDWEPMPGKKGVRRYISPELRRLAKRLEEAHEQREAAGAGILQVPG